jgi:hypothetical protein
MLVRAIDLTFLSLPRESSAYTSVKKILNNSRKKKLDYTMLLDNLESATVRLNDSKKKHVVQRQKRRRIRTYHHLTEKKTYNSRPFAKIFTESSYYSFD